MINSSSFRAIEHLLSHCGDLKSDETLIIICDSRTDYLGQAFKEVAESISKSVQKIVVNTITRHGMEPPESVAALMLRSDLIVSLCTFSLAHSHARIEAAKNGARFLSLPLYSEELLNDPAVMVDYKLQAPVVHKIAKTLTEGQYLHVSSEAGTDIKMNITGRSGNSCPGMVHSPGDLGSPPDIEANISPIEAETFGRACIDGSITCEEIGLLKTPVIMKIEKGFVTEIRGRSKKNVSILNSIFGNSSSKRRILAECGIGLNPKATLSGIMLTDEGCLGAVHFGFGSNSTVGGENKVDFHLDFVFKNATLSVDNQKILKNGELVL